MSLWITRRKTPRLSYRDMLYPGYTEVLSTENIQQWKFRQSFVLSYRSVLKIKQEFS